MNCFCVFCMYMCGGAFSCLPLCVFVCVGVCVRKGFVCNHEGFCCLGFLSVITFYCFEGNCTT